MADALTDDVIAEAMRRAEQAIDPPLDDHCCGLALSAAAALAAKFGFAVVGPPLTTSRGRKVVDTVWD